MIEYLSYRIAFFLADHLPLELTYFIASVLSRLQYLFARRDRIAVKKNMSIVTGNAKEAFKNGASMYKNFGMYLVDFFRFQKIDQRFIQEKVEVVGRKNLDEALKRGNGVIALTAHLGNWELGGVVASLLGYEIYGVALRHKDERVNNFFNKQRNIKGLKVIPLGIAVRRCFQLLKQNKMIALLGDRIFAEDNLEMAFNFFGKEVYLPKGPAVLSLKTEAAIVPGFMLRESENRYKLIFETPIYPPEAVKPSDESIRKLVEQYIPILEKFIRKYPTQWFMFREFWK